MFIKCNIYIYIVSTKWHPCIYLVDTFYVFVFVHLSAEFEPKPLVHCITYLLSIMVNHFTHRPNLLYQITAVHTNILIRYFSSGFQCWFFIRIPNGAFDILNLNSLSNRINKNISHIFVLWCKNLLHTITPNSLLVRLPSGF